MFPAGSGGSVSPAPGLTGGSVAAGSRGEAAASDDTIRGPPTKLLPLKKQHPTASVA